MQTNQAAIAVTLLAAFVALASFGILFGRAQLSGLVSSPTGTVSAEVSGGTDIFLKNATVNFAAVQVGASYDTSLNYSNSSQFLLRNDGSVKVNVTIAATALWNSTSGNNTNYRYNVTEAVGNTTAFEYDNNCDSTHNNNTYYTMPMDSTSARAVCKFDFTDANDHARIDIQITVPGGEAAGTKSSTVTFTASEA